MKAEDPIEAELKRITAEQKKLAAALEGVLRDLAKRRAIVGSNLATTEVQAIELTLNAAERSVTIGSAKAYLQPRSFRH